LRCGATTNLPNLAARLASLSPECDIAGRPDLSIWLDFKSPVSITQTHRRVLTFPVPILGQTGELPAR